MAAVGTEERITLKLMVLKEENKVIFAEAGKDFVDVLFSFLTLPLGTIARVARKESKLQPSEVASLSSLYQSVENLDKECFPTDTCKEMLLCPRNSMEAYCRSSKINIDDTEPTEYFVCSNLICCRDEPPVLISTFRNKRCRCGSMLAKPISPETFDSFDGFVQTNSSFMITDDLKVFPNSLDKIINVLKDSGIENMSLISERTVNITKNQVVDLLKYCFCSISVLTDLFLEKGGRDYRETLLKRRRITPCDLKANNCDGIIVKIVLRKSTGKILFAEGKADFADFLFTFLTIPLGALCLMGGCPYVDSVDGLYKSVVDLDEDYFTTKEVKNKFVDPVLAPQFKLHNLLSLKNGDVPNYFCYVLNNGYFRNRVIEWTIRACSLTPIHKVVNGVSESCVASEFLHPLSDTSNNGKGYVKGPTTYMVTDDLVVTPSSSLSVVSLLRTMNIPRHDLQEKVVSIGKEEGVRILQASLSSRSALTLGLSHLTK
ncbi:hypothetical protein LR48_Vigan03g092800 [Vigna angularis]|uniref:DUF674 family protein n=1 Tax=Phaseolus angularis TaxID=3914 RepID=A0A0L9U448_PHAAN|nr:uncharacterized protein LOC108328625 [Vigna angularis]KOM37546.1 hypothetical protein LR48_Vigan03g092800 [Vigna angularis]